MASNKEINSVFDKNNKISTNMILKNLDKEQSEAVLSPAQDTLILAVAGSGKTRTLCHHVAFLISNGIPEENIMLLTFTNKASNEMIERVKGILAKDDIKVLGGTFHHVGVLFLRKYAEAIGYKRNFSILTPDDSKRLVEEARKKYLKEHSLKKSEFPEKKVIYDFYSKSINRNMSYDELNKEDLNFPQYIMEGIETIIEDYIYRKKRANSMDFDDLLVNFREILKIDYIRNKINLQFTHILSDEYQDTNLIQYNILELLRGQDNRIYFVGDISQSIYSWRGSNIEYIQNFERLHLNGEIYAITHNYRSDANILRLAEYSINHNYTDNHKVKITPFLKGVNMPTVYRADEDYQQAEYMARKIKEYNKSGIPFSEIAVLIRANRLTVTMEKVFRQRGIPYKILSGKSFFERKHIKDLMSFITLLVNPQDEPAFLRVCEMFDGVGEKTVERMFDYFKDNAYDINELQPDKLIKPCKIKKNVIDNVTKMCDLLQSINSCKDDLSKVLDTIMYDYYKSYMKNNFEDYSDRMKDVEFFLDSAKTYEDITTFLTDMTLDDAETSKDKDHQNQVTITTVHKAKGLEWDCVFLPYMNDGYFPGLRKCTISEIQEERRLFYVAVTRAKKHLNMSYLKYQSQTFKPLYPSMFLEELNEDLYDVE